VKSLELSIHDRLVCLILYWTLAYLLMSNDGRGQLSREIIARTAIKMTDDIGLEGLSMRKLGSLLGVEAMSLYHYIENKADLLDAMLDSLFEEINLPQDVPDDDWETAIRLAMQSFLDVLLKHTAALELVTTRPVKTRSSLDLLVWAAGRFQSVGLTLEQASHALHFTVSIAAGHAAIQEAFKAILTEINEPRFDRLDEPTAAFVRHNRNAAEVEPDMFSAVVDTAIAGLRANYNLP